MAKYLLGRVLFGPTVFGWLGFLRFYWEKAVHWLVWLFNFFNQLRTWLKWLKTMVGIRWSFSRHRFSSVVFLFENSALKTLSPKCWQPLQPKSEELSENYCTQSQSPFNLKRFGNYSIGDLQISQNGLWLKRLVPIEHHLCGKRATVTSRQFYLIIFLTHLYQFKKTLKDSKRMTTRGRSTNGDDVEEKKKNGKNTRIDDSHCLVEHQNQ